MSPPDLRKPFVILAVTAAVACMKSRDAAVSADTTPAVATHTTLATPAQVVSGFHHPESVRYDADQDVYFVSNIDGDPTARDGKGEIAKLKPDGTSDMTFIVGGKNGVTLNAPKGLAITGNTLWVADIDVVRAFNRLTGKPIATIDLSKRPSHFLNDVAAGPDGSLYITDSGLLTTKTDTAVMAIIHLVGRTATTIAHGAPLEQPNGVTWDAANSRLLMVPLGGPDMFAWKQGDSTLTKIGSGPGGYDGLEILGDTVLVTSWADKSFGILDHGTYRAIAKGIDSPADIGLDTKRGVVAVPNLNHDEVQLWALHPAAASADTTKH